MTNSLTVVLAGLCLLGMVGISSGDSDSTECMVKGALSFLRIMDCGDCVNNLKCMYCDAPLVKTCFPFPSNGLLPSSDVCSMDHAKWAVCTISYRVLLIIIGVVLAVLLFSIIGCCCCCCCCRRGGGYYPQQIPPSVVLVSDSHVLQPKYERLEEE